MMLPIVWYSLATLIFTVALCVLAVFVCGVAMGIRSLRQEAEFDAELKRVHKMAQALGGTDGE